MSLYDEFMTSFRLANTDITKKNQYKSGNKAWNELKEGNKVVEQKVKDKILEYKCCATKRKHENSLAFFKVSKPKESAADNGLSQELTEEVVVSESESQASVVEPAFDEIPSVSTKRKAPAYKQDSLKSEIELLNTEISAFAAKQLKKVLDDNERELLKSKLAERDLKEKQLIKTEATGKRQANSRGKRAKISNGNTPIGL